MDKHIRGFLKYIALERRYSAHTVESYAGDLEQFATFLTNYFNTREILWPNIKKAHIRHFMVSLQEHGISRRSVARKLAALKSFFKYLTREEIIELNPALSIKMPRFEKKLPEFIPQEEVDAIMRLPQVNTFEGLRDLAILELLYGTGMRLSELIDLKVSDLLLNEDLVRVFGKGSKERIVPLGASAKQILEKYLEIRPQYVEKNVDTVFILKSGKRMYPVAVQRIIKKYLSNIPNLDKKSPHVLRHSYATHLLNAGASIRVVKDLLGHENLSTTQVYTHLSIDHLKSIYNRAHPGASDKSSIKLRRS